MRSFDVRSRIHNVVLPAEVGDFADEIRRMFLDLGRTFGAEALAGECSPALDVERGFGRFARTVRIAPACDPANARATLSNGELRISVPKIADRRGTTIQIPVKTGGAG